VLSRSRDGKLTLRVGDLPLKHRAKAETWMPEPDFKQFDANSTD
jgi:hypothetical protein